MNELHQPPPPRRLFTALFPPEEATQAIDAERQRWAGLPRRLHPVPARMHVTLQFFNAVDAPHERDWLAALSSLRFAPFELALDRAELWDAPSGRIAVLRPSASAALDALHDQTARLARQAGLPATLGAWQPHLTTVRRADAVAPLALAQPIRWTVHRVDLIWSNLKSQPPCYHRLGGFPHQEAP
ncbi:2'-5' RNA ligase family protein [Ottowia testudinis]|uniref:2'-5' RNA ligase family protein n=1 Tax=Ottowia testudinis TaxID=2816950 RepID=A0A975CI86_9BURK|nr:2'-5' RNA ligase family protein [Ottowia testudinis]QTD46928.1 2'-5' RNA ligase family protein [Ottowia testudinis]